MEKHIAQRWIASFLAIVLAVMALLSGIAYIVDPFFQFRVKDNSYMLSGWFVGSGLIENYDYDTLIVGSSMTQNFDMGVFRSELGVKPLHVGLGGIRSSEIHQLMNAAYDANKAKDYFICVDLLAFTGDSAESRYPKYLLKKDAFSRLRYLLSYEAWFRYIPVDVCFMLLDRLGVDLPLKFAYSKSVDRLEDWRLDYTFGKDVVLNNYVSDKYSVSEVDVENLYERMTAHIDDYLLKFQFEKGTHTFFFPPYSSLYWCDAQNGGYFDACLSAKQYFVERATEYGANVYDFQCAGFTVDLNNYKDTTHYRPEINDWMVECFANRDYFATIENYDIFQEKLIENTNSFRSEYSELFE